jgi:hypothetical protein
VGLADVEILARIERRRKWTAQEKAALLAEVDAEGGKVTLVARRHRISEIDARTLHIEKLQMQLAVLRRARFGRSSEKLDRDIEQLELLIGEVEEEAGEAAARDAASNPAAGKDPDNPARSRRHPVRKPLPAHLPRESLIHEPACTCPGGGGTVFSRIGQDEREVLGYVPSSFKVVVHVRPKLSCRGCCRAAPKSATAIFAGSMAWLSI